MATLSPNGTLADAGDIVSLGDYTHTVVPQRIGRLKKRLGRAMGDLQNLNAGSLEAFVDEGLERAHAILAVFIPDLMPLYEFCGYRSQAAMEDDADDDEGEYGPTLPDIVAAFEVVMRVNRLDLLGHLRSVISPTLMRAYVSEAIADSLRASDPLGRTSSSPSTSSTPGPDTPLTTSGTTLPTSVESAG